MRHKQDLSHAILKQDSASASANADKESGEAFATPKKPRLLSRRPDRSRSNRFPREDHLDPLINTKLSPPLASANLVPRTRLMQRLEEGLQHRLVLVSAPAGSGKTTLLSQWAVNCSLPTAWVSLDAADSDPVRFLSSIIAAIRTQHPSFGGAALALLRSASARSVEAVVTLMVNEIASEAGELVLILDDYHAIKHEAIHQGMTLLLEHPAPRLHLVIATRSDPPFPLARFRAKGQMVEFRVADLNFTLAETDSFLNQTMRLGLKTDEVTALEKRTEGWIVGLMTAALSVRERGDIHKFVETFSGDNWRIVDYLIEEVVNRQPEAVQRFLMRTSILDRLNSSLVEAVVGLPEGEGQPMLEYLERANLFTSPLDSCRSWYRYHPLFAECLRARLRLLHPREEQILHLAASVWFKSKGMADSAMKHAVAGEEFELAADLVEAYAESMVAHSEVATLLDWLGALPEVIVRVRPFLAVWMAHALLASGQVDAAEAHLLDAVRWLEIEKDKAQGEIEQRYARRISNHTLALRAAIAATRRDAQLTILLSRQALERSFGSDERFLRGRLLHNLGSAYLWDGDVVSAEKMLTEALLESEQPGNPFTSVLASCQLAGVQVARGRLHEASRTNQRAIQLAMDMEGKVQPIAGRAYLGLALLYYEWNDLEAARRWAIEGLELARQSGMMDILSLGYRVAARLAQARGDWGEAANWLQEAECLARANRLRQELARVSIYQTRLQLACGDLNSAIHWAEATGLSAKDEPTYLREAAHLTLARLLIAQDQYGEAVSLLERLLTAAETSGRVDSAIKILVLLAPAVERLHRPDLASRIMGQALLLAEADGYVRTFLDGGKPIAALLARCAHGVKQNTIPVSSKAYAQRLLEAVESETRPAEVEKERNALRKGVVELLSKREEEVLQLIAAGWSRPQIAAGLLISSNTVRTHTKTIYGKLEVHNRAEALAKARDLGLLSS